MFTTRYSNASIMSDLRYYGTRQDRYAYKRMKQGIYYHLQDKKKIRFLTLTGINRKSGWRLNFNALRRVLRRKFGIFEYFCIRTDEGTDGVLHILYIGKSFRYKELKEYWKKRTDYWTVSISRVKDFYGIGLEMTRQGKVVRYTQSRNWIPFEKYKGNRYEESMKYVNENVILTKDGWKDRKDL